MTSEDEPATTLPFDDMADVLGRVRQVDPNAEDAGVRGYVREIAEASALLDTMDLTASPLDVSFSASWPEGSGR
jgi:hypothetical protein